MSAMAISDALFSRTRSGIFRELFRTPEGFHLRALERRTGINSRHLLRELRALRDAGILVPQRIGNLVVYRFDPECPIYDDLQSLIRKTVGLADGLRAMLEPFQSRIELAYVFGSHARGAERADSDIDVMVVGHVTRRQLSSAIRRAEETLRRQINIVLYTPDEYGSALEDESSFVSRVHNGSRIELVVDSEHEPPADGAERRSDA
jgi:predicted nucleotidyltransferase